MSWRDNLLDASFKGATFKVQSHNYIAGRRTALHEYANREVPYLQDNGRAADVYTINGYIIQNKDNFYNYFAQRDALINALRSKGPGILVHPFLGIKKVGLSTPANITETFDRGGIVRISMTFTEAGIRALPQKVTDFLTNLDAVVNRAFDFVGDYFSAGYQTFQAFMDVANTAVNRSMELNQAGIAAIQNISTKVIDQTLQNINAIKATTEQYINLPNNTYNSLKDTGSSFAIICGLGSLIKQEAEDSKGSVKDDTEEATTDRAENVFINKLIIDEEIIGGNTGNFSGVTRGSTVKLTGTNIPSDMGKSILKSMSDILEDYDMSVYITTPTSQQKNIALITNINKFSLIAYAARIAIRINFVSQQDADEYKDLLVDRMEDFLLELGTEASTGAYGLGIGVNVTDAIDNSNIYTSVKDIRNAFVAAMKIKSSDLAKEINYKVSADVKSCLELSYDKYEDSNRYKEIYTNNITLSKHPGFLPNGENILILSK